MELIDVFLWVGIGSIVVACLVVVAVGCHAISTQGESVSYSSSRLTQSNPPPPPPPKAPEGFIVTDKFGSLRFIGAPAWFQPDIEPIESILKRMYGEEEFQKQCWDSKFLDRLQNGDEVRRQVMWLQGAGDPDSRYDYTRSYHEEMYWMDKRDGEDFVAWYSRYQERLNGNRKKIVDRYWEENIKPVMDEVKAQPDFATVYTNADGTGYKEIYKDGQKKREYF